MVQPEILYPILALITWTCVMWVWLYATRIPAMQDAGIDVQDMSRTGAPLVLPPQVARVADNYNHLHEQPTVFYALVLCAGMLGAVDSLQVLLAWAYVAIRVVHSLIQATRNIILVRFTLFVLGSLVLFVLLGRTIYMVL